MITEEMVYKVLDALYKNTRITSADVGMDKEDFNDALDMISDCNYAKNIKFSRGAKNQILIAFYDNAKITMEGLHFLNGYRQPSPVDKNDENKCVFLSYCWNDNAVADSIDAFLQSKGYEVKRDIRDIGRWHSIREFMNTIRTQDYAVLIISDRYLRSANCMYEVGQMLKEEDFRNRIIPVVVEISIYDPIKRIDYIRYWEDETNKLESAMKEISMTSRGEATETLKRYKNISMQMGEFLQTVSDMNNPKLTDINEAIIEKLQS